MSPNLKLIYFDAPGRAEVTRMMLKFGGHKFEDYRFKDRDEWMTVWKPNATYGQCPLLEVDGKTLAQSSAIERYAASLTPGLIPTNNWSAAKVNEAVAFQTAIVDTFYPTCYITDVEARIKARKKKEITCDLSIKPLTKIEKIPSLAS